MTLRPCMLEVSVFGISTILKPSTTGSAATEFVLPFFVFVFRYNATNRA